jgi:hypothetical protein
MSIRLRVLAMLVIGAVLMYALYRKGDVKARFKVPFVEFSIETKDKS